LSLFQDMLPDSTWAKREKGETASAGLTMRRARQLHAAISVRNYTIWSLILTACSLATKLNEKGDIAVSLPFSAVALFCVYLIAAHQDSQRNRDVNWWFPVSVPTPRHFLEATAIPAFFIGFFCLLILLFAVKPAYMDPASPFYEPIRWFFWTIRYTPWMGLTALIMALGAWLRWREVSLEDSSKLEPAQLRS
jgi:hypothetical protein